MSAVFTANIVFNLQVPDANPATEIPVPLARKSNFVSVLTRTLTGQAHQLSGIVARTGTLTFQLS
jgi:hypothetical protein